MALDQGIYVTMRGHIGSSVCDTPLWYSTDVFEPAITSSSVVTAFIAEVWTAQMRALISNQFTLDSVECYIFSDLPGGSSPLHIGIVNEAGTNADESLPPYVTLNLTKLPNNATRDPITASAFSPGFVGFSGIPEISQNRGLLTGIATTNWQAVADALWQLAPASITPRLITLGMYRFPDEDYPFLLPGKVLTEGLLVKQKLGSRNSRKY